MTVYEHHTEAFAVVEKWIGRTTDKSAGRVDMISERLDELAAAGWVLVSMTPMPVVGALWRSSERRTLTVGVFRRPARTGSVLPGDYEAEAARRRAAWWSADDDESAAQHREHRDQRHAEFEAWVERRDNYARRVATDPEWRAWVLSDQITPPAWTQEEPDLLPKEARALVYKAKRVQLRSPDDKKRPKALEALAKKKAEHADTLQDPVALPAPPPPPPEKVHQ